MRPKSSPVKIQAAPIATSGDNVYIVWWSNKTGNNEVMFRASTDGGKTFADKINLSNTPKSYSSVFSLTSALYVIADSSYDDKNLYEYSKKVLGIDLICPL